MFYPSFGLRRYPLWVDGYCGPVGLASSNMPAVLIRFVDPTLLRVRDKLDRMFPERIETDSLVLSPLHPAHIDIFDLYDLFAEGTQNSQGVFEYVPQEPFTTVKDAQEWLTVGKREWEDRESARYAVSRPDQTLVGTAVLSLNWDFRKGSLAVLLARPYWGNGYAGECAMALTELAFDRLDLAVVTLGYDEGNQRSKAAIERFVNRIGGQYDGVVRNATQRGDEIVDAHDYSITREQYQLDRDDR